MSNNSIDKGFRDKLGYFSAEPSEDLWLGIEKDLEQKKNRKMFFILTRAAAILIPVTGLVVGLLLLNRPKDYIGPGASDQKAEVISVVKDSIGKNTITEKIVARKEMVTITRKKNFYTSYSDKRKSVESASITSSKEDSMYSLYNDSGLLSREQLPSLENSEFFELSDTQVYSASLTPYKKPISQQELHDLTIQAIDEKTIDQPISVQLGASGGPQFSSGAKSDNSTISNGNISSKDMLAYTGGMNVMVKPWKRLSVETGVYYAKQSVQNEISSRLYANPSPVVLNQLDNNWSVENLDNSTVYQIPYDNIISGELTPTKEENIQLEEVFNVIEIPVVFKYRLIDRKLDVNMIYSIGALYEVSRTLDYSDNLAAINSSNGYETSQRMNFGNSVGVGLDIPLQSNFVFNIEPQAKYYLLSRNSLFSKSNNNYSLNFMMGLKYKF